MRQRMQRAFLCVGATLLLAASLATAQANGGQTLTPEPAINVRTVSDLRFAPDGERVAFVVSEPPKGTERRRHIWLLDVKSKAVRQFTNSQKTEDSPRWSPDGKRLAFLSDREQFRQIYLISLEGGEAQPLTEGKRGIQSFSWSPDGKQIAFLAPEAKTEKEEQKEEDKDDARVVDKDDKLARVWLIDVEGKKTRQLTSGRWKVNDAQWVPDGTRLIVSATEHPESDDETNRIYSLNISDGKLTELAAPRGPFRGIRVSPDGAGIVYVGCRVDGPSPHDLYYLPLSGGAARNLTANSVDRPIGSYEWRSNQALLTTIERGFREELISVGLDGKASPPRGLPVNVRSFAMSASGTLVFTGVNAGQQEEIWVQQGESLAQSVSSFNVSWAKFKLIAPEMVHYKSFDGLEIEAALLKPAGYQAGKRVPLIVLVHGGPTGAWSDSIEPWGQLLAAHGFAVLYPNIRGSSGYGQHFMEINRADWGGGDYRDVMAGVDYLIAQGIADPERLGIGGWSYGGYMSEWAITQTDRFKAAVSGAGLANLASEYGTEFGPAYDKWFYGVPYENLDGFMKSSPVKYLKNARTPTLILQGDADTTDPLGQSQELYRGLKHYGVEAEMVVYPREPHGLREEKHLLDRLNRIVAWYESHLK